MPVRLVIADDHQAIRVGLAAILLGTECEIVAQATNVEEIVSYTSTCRPDVVLMDLRMPGGDSFQAVRTIKTNQSDTRVVVFTGADSIAAMVGAHQSGADGFVVKGSPASELLATIRRVAAGKDGWTRHQRRQLGPAQQHAYDGNYCVGLTKREGEILEGIQRGSTNDEIADNLGIKSEAVKQHVKGLLRKLGVEDRTQAALWKVRCDHLADALG